MKALIFAHRMEAIAFLDHLQPRSCEKNIYRSDDLFITYSGEGLFSALYHIQNLLLQYPEIEEVWNYGLAASLNGQQELHTIQSIGNIYRQKDQENMDFQSFALSGEMDLVTSIDRVNDAKTKTYLSRFASLVDREAWAYAYACQRTHKTFRAFKLVSDFAEDLECSQIRSRAEALSLMMWEDYLQRHSNPSLPAKTISLPKGFYFTASLAHRYRELNKKLQKKRGCNSEELLCSLETKKILELKILPKEKTKILLEKMEEALDPDFFTFKKKLQANLTPWKEQEIYFDFGPYLEPNEGQLQMRFQNDKDFLTKLQRLQNMKPSSIFPDPNES